MPNCINYVTQVYCAHCGEKHDKTECKFIKNWGFKCPECGGKCRVKPKNPYSNYLKTHPYIRRKCPITMKTEIKRLVQESRKKRSGLV